MTKRYILNAEEEALYRRARRLITPSKIGSQHWEGHWREGEAFSIEQLRELGAMGLDAATIDRDVIAAGDPNRIYIPMQPYFYRRLPCPIIGKVKDRLRVISPAGDRKLVYPDGSLTRPKARRWAA